MSEPVGKVLIYFGGICTFFEELPQFVPPREKPVRRMVMANANIHAMLMGGGQEVQVNPHLARLRFHTPFQIEQGQLPPRVENTEEYELNQQAGAYTISVLDPIIPPGLNLLWTNSSTCLPSLQGSLGDVKISAPSLAVIEGGNAACYADFTAGLIEGFTVEKNGMGIARATIFTEGPPQLSIVQNGQITAIVQLEGDPAILAITNKPATATPGADSPDDFYLNFLIVENPPLIAQVTPPGSVSCHKINRENDPHLPPEFVTADAGPGCSTTDYP